MTLTQTYHFCVRKSLLSNDFTCSIILITHIAQLFLIRKVYCFRKCPHVSFKYARHNHLLYINLLYYGNKNIFTYVVRCFLSLYNIFFYTQLTFLFHLHAHIVTFFSCYFSRKFYKNNRSCIWKQIRNWSRDEIIPVLLFTSFCRDKLSSRDELIPLKKTEWNFIWEWKQKRCEHSSRDEILQLACFYLIFDACTLYAFQL